MKTAVATMSVLALLAASAPQNFAGDKEWATAGKVLTGVGAGLLLAKALEPQPIYTAPPVYLKPAPVVVHQRVQTVVVQQPVQTVVYSQPVVQQPVLVQQPVIVQHPVVVHAPPVAFQAAPVLVQPVPVYPAPVFCTPPPRVGFHISIGGHGHRHGHHHHRRHRHW